MRKRDITPKVRKVDSGAGWHINRVTIVGQPATFEVIFGENYVGDRATLDEARDLKDSVMCNTAFWDGYHALKAA
jgi:hypothetical protein